MSLLSVSCRACRSSLGGTFGHIGPSCTFATTSTARDAPLPSRDWGRIPRAGPSSNDGGRPAPRAPQRRNPNQQSDNQGAGSGSGSGGGARRNRGSKMGWNGNTKPAPSFGLRNRASEPAQQGEKKDLTAYLKDWNVSVQSPSGPLGEADRSSPRGSASSSTSTPRFSTPDAEDESSDRRSRFGDRGVRESRGFEASRRSGDGDFVINRNTRQWSKKGKERETDHHRPPPGDKRPVKPKKGGEKVKAVEKEVYIPSTVTVSRLADIFGVKICTSTSTLWNVKLMCGSQPADEDDALGNERRPTSSRFL